QSDAFDTFFYLLTSTTEIYTLSLHDALPIYADRWVRSPWGGCRRAGWPGPGARRPLPCSSGQRCEGRREAAPCRRRGHRQTDQRDRKSTRLNSSHVKISYAVFCLKKKKRMKE